VKVFSIVDYLAVERNLLRCIEALIQNFGTRRNQVFFTGIRHGAFRNIDQDIYAKVRALEIHLVNGVLPAAMVGGNIYALGSNDMLKEAHFDSNMPDMVPG
jgi:hypothetical protein